MQTLLQYEPYLCVLESHYAIVYHSLWVLKRWARMNRNITKSSDLHVFQPSALSATTEDPRIKAAKNTSLEAVVLLEARCDSLSQLLLQFSLVTEMRRESQVRIRHLFTVTR